MRNVVWLPALSLALSCACPRPTTTEGPTAPPPVADGGIAVIDGTPDDSRDEPVLLALEVNQVVPLPGTSLSVTLLDFLSGEDVLARDGGPAVVGTATLRLPDGNETREVTWPMRTWNEALGRRWRIEIGRDEVYVTVARP